MNSVWLFLLLAIFTHFRGILNRGTTTRMTKNLLRSLFMDIQDDDDRAKNILKQLKSEFPKDKYLVAINPGGVLKHGDDITRTISFSIPAFG
ncbi:hypothetical protein Trydic_g3661 [Trypoxylus dichotomus]